MKKNYLFFICLFFVNLLNSYAGRYYVNSNASGANDGSSWSNAFVSLASALSQSSSGDEIWVSTGIYKPTIDGFIIPSGVKVYGGFSGTETELNQRAANTYTTLDGNIGDLSIITDNATHVVFMRNVNNQTRLDGFKVINGWSNNFSNDAKGGGLYNLRGNPTIANCLFLDNFSENYGGGICSESGSIRIENCEIANNTTEGFGAGIHFSQTGTAIILNSKISNNKSIYGSGGGISTGNGFSSLTIDRTEISGNTVQDFAGAMILGDDTAVSIYNSLILGNTALKGIIYMNTAFNTASHKIINTTFSGNKSREISNRSCTLVFNHDTQIANCIFWDNTAPSGNIYKFKTINDPLVTNCIIEGGHESGTNNSTADPKFKNPASKDNAPFTSEGYDFSLAPTSPGINAGSNDFLSVNFNLDLAGFNRNYNSDIVDIGCYEYQATLSIKTEELLKHIAYYNADKKNIFIKIDDSSKTAYELYNLNGQLLDNGTVLGGTSISMENYYNGLYFLILTSLESKHRVTKKIVKY